LDDQVSITRLVLRYVAMAGVALVAVALVTAIVARRIGTSTAVDDADRATRLIVGSAVEPALLRTGRSDTGTTDLSEPENRFEDSATQTGGPVGVMLHHAVMDGAERLELGRLLALGR
jgi:hypothetical protein